MTGDLRPGERPPRLFDLGWTPEAAQLPVEVSTLAIQRREGGRSAGHDVGVLTPGPGQDLVELFERAEDPTDGAELARLFLGRVEARVRATHGSRRNELLQQWQRSRPRRTVSTEELLFTSSTITLVKELFNAYFRDDLYGDLRSQASVILSSGAVDEELFGLPGPLRECIGYAVQRDWYGYSDSRGREASRDAIARYESARMQSHEYDVRNVAIGLGGTSLMAAVADLVLTGRTSGEPAVCGIPNYPPLVQAVNRRGPTALAPITEAAGQADLSQLIATIRPDTPLVLLQTALNPTGAAVSDQQLARLLQAAGPNTVVVLDECHEWLGEFEQFSAVRTDPRVVRVNSVSKNWSAPGLKVGWLVGSAQFIDEFYEYSSTNYGGPASVFYTMIEFAARMERWRIEGLSEIGDAELAELEPSYRLTRDTLSSAYRRYTEQRARRAGDLSLLRDASCQLLHRHGVSPIDPPYSINVAVPLGAGRDGYTFFRELLSSQGVSVFPGILTFVLSQDLVRVTSARSWTDLSRGLPPLARLAAEPVTSRAWTSTSLIATGMKER